MTDLFPTGEKSSQSDPVECLGQIFPSDQARHEHFLNLLAEKLKDPDFRKIDGFPIGTDEDILDLSDPPYYTACPNPWITDFIAAWEAEKPDQPEGHHYHREPFAADVSEGKNDPIYNAHSYHTKVPHKAIMRYILHYTNPGDIVFDGFCGTGMTGVAAQLCGNREAIISLGYQVKPDGTILREETDKDGNKVWQQFSRLGSRRAILNDLSPAATFISYNYNTPIDVASFDKKAKLILKEVEKECGWMYETLHADGSSKGKINFTVRSDVFTCPECAGEINFWKDCVDKEAGQVGEQFACPHCGASLSKKKLERVWHSTFDNDLNRSVSFAKQVPVLINYSVGSKRYEKEPDSSDLEIIRKIDEGKIPNWYPTNPLPDGYNTAQPAKSHGITHVHQFYTKRNLWVLSSVLRHLEKADPRYKAWFTSTMSWVGRELRLHLGNYFGGGGGVITSLRGTLYVASLSVETNVLARLALRIRWQAFRQTNIEGTTIQETCGASACSVPPNSCDYIFLDPPFGSNLNYSELNSLLESWLGALTNNKPEAIENKVQNKGLPEYRVLMTECFKKAYSALKPGRWMTVEFSNTKASVWNNIQTALTEAGFIVGNVSALDKKKGSFKACTTPTAVKQDLVISAYKPNGGFEERFQKEAQTEEGVWDFVRTHLQYLPVTKRQAALLQFIPERDPRILFDQMLTYYVRKGYPVPVSSQEFQEGLRRRFDERDGMFFLSDQSAEYDKKRAQMAQAPQMELFVSDERSAIDWLTEFLKKRPSTYQEIHPEFTKQLGAGWRKHEAKPELAALLEDNFLRYEGNGDVPSQIHSYLSTNHKDLRGLEKSDKRLGTKAKDRWFVPDPNKAQDLEKKREKALLKEFETYLAFTGRKLKEFRLEVLRAGFKAAWVNKDYQTIIKLAQKIPEASLQEDEQLLMWYDHALTRVEDNL